MSFSRFGRRALACAATLLVTLVAPAPVHADALPSGFKPFAPDSIWNQPLRADAPLHPNSETWRDWLTASIDAHGAWVNTFSCGMPMYWAAPDTPRVAVALDHPVYMDPALIRAWSAVPIPPDAAAANCGDKNFAVFQRQPDGRVFSWEFWSATKRADGSWIAKWGGASTDAMADRGIGSALAWSDPTAPTPQSSASSFGWNVTASSVSMSAGVITLDELTRGTIDHALSIATYDAAQGSFLWPAQRTDGNSTDPAAIPEGAHLRLDPSFDVETMTATPLVKMMARAAQKYGIVIRDRTLWNTAFYVQQPPPGAGNPLTPVLDGKALDKAMLAFPWSRMQVLDAPTCSGWAECKAPTKATIDVDTPSPRAGEPVRLDTSRSVLNQPRSRVDWDFDGDGTFEACTGAATTAGFTPASAGARTVAVKITTRDGEVVTGSRTISVAAKVGAEATTWLTLRPTQLATKYFYSYSSAYSALNALTATTASPDVPLSTRKLYSSTASGSATIGFQDLTVPAAGTTRVQAYVECAATRCLRLSVLDGAGTVLGQLDPAFGAKGWATVPVTTRLSAEQLAGLQLSVTVRNGPSASGSASLSAVQAVVPVAR